MNELVSVLIPVFNAEHVIDRCIKSLLNQTYKNIEVIIVDDCSTDDSYVMVEEWANKEKNIYCYKNKTNSGCAATINRALTYAKGTVVAIVDNDDYVESDYIEYLLTLMHSSNADISICGWYEDKKPFQLYNRELTSKEALEELLLDTTFRAYYWNKLFRREILGSKPFIEEQKFEDMASMPYIFQKARKVVIGAKPKYHYAMGTTNFSANKKSYLNYWLSRAYFERLSFVVNNQVSGQSKNYVIMKTCHNSVGSWRELMRLNQNNEAVDLYQRIKSNKKLFLSCPKVSLKHKLYLIARIV